MAKHFRASITWVHTWAGLLFCWVLYFMFATGTLGYFDSEIDIWMQPELYQQNNTHHQSIRHHLLTGTTWLAHHAADANTWSIYPPNHRETPYLRVVARFAKDQNGESVTIDQRLDPQTGQVLKSRETGGGQALYQMHYFLHYLPKHFAYRLVGLFTFVLLLTLVSGVIIHKNIFKDFFTFRAHKRKRAWLDMHNLLSVSTLPFQLMISYSGLIFVISLWMPLIGVGSYGFDINAFKTAAKEMSQPRHIAASQQQRVAPLALDAAIATAKNQLGSAHIGSMQIRHPGDRQASIIIYKHLDTPSRYRENMVFDGLSGTLLQHNQTHKGMPMAVHDTFLGLHEGLYAKLSLRWLYFLSGILGMGMVATGAIYWTVKRQKKITQQTHHRGYRLVNQLNIGTIAGLPLAIAAYFWANRLLPVTMDNRAAWELHTLFIVWLLALLYPTIRGRQQSWLGPLSFAALCFYGIPIVNALTTDRGLLFSIHQGDWVFAGFDLTCIATGLCLSIAVYQLQRRTNNNSCIGDNAR